MNLIDVVRSGQHFYNKKSGRKCTPLHVKGGFICYVGNERVIPLEVQYILSDEWEIIEKEAVVTKMKLIHAVMDAAWPVKHNFDSGGRMELAIDVAKRLGLE